MKINSKHRSNGCGRVLRRVAVGAQTTARTILEQLMDEPGQYCLEVGGVEVPANDPLYPHVRPVAGRQPPSIIVTRHRRLGAADLDDDGGAGDDGGDHEGDGEDARWPRR